VWFFVIADCITPKDVSEESYQKYGAKVQIMALNGDSQFSEEECGMMRNLAIAGAFVLVMLFQAGFKFLADLTEYSLETMQNPLVLICGATGMILAKIMLQEANLLIFTYNGYGFFLFKFMSTYIFVMAQCLLSLVFVGLAFGMGLKNSQFSKIFNNETLMISFDQDLKVLVAITVVVICHAITAVSIFYDHEEDHKYHDY
jgi:hypothetical protein